MANSITDELTPSLNMSLEGRVHIESGKMLIIDPAYLEEYEGGPIDTALRVYEDFVMDGLTAISSEYTHALCKLPKISAKKPFIYSKLPDYISKDDTINVEIRVLPDSEFEELLKDSKLTEPTIKELLKEAKQLLARAEDFVNLTESREKKSAEFLAQHPFLNPPYFAQFNECVFFHNRTGDGYYPVIERPKRIKIIHNFQMKSSSKGIFVDKKRLKGKLIGMSMVDTAAQIITDFDKAKIEKDISPELYCVAYVPKGDYACKFVNHGYEVSIRKLPLNK